MKKRNKAIAVITTILGIVLILNYSGILHPIKIEDLDIAAKLEINKINGTNGEKYVLNIDIDKRNSGKNIIYTYLPGYSGVSIYDGQGNFILAGKAKLDYLSKNLALKELEMRIGKKVNVSILNGNGIPYKKGNYHCKIFKLRYRD